MNVSSISDKVPPEDRVEVPFVDSQGFPDRLKLILPKLAVAVQVMLQPLLGPTYLLLKLGPILNPASCI